MMLWMLRRRRRRKMLMLRRMMSRRKTDPKIEIHMNIAQEPFCAEIYGENAGR